MYNPDAFYCPEWIKSVVCLNNDDMACYIELYQTIGSLFLQMTNILASQHVVFLCHVGVAKFICCSSTCFHLVMKVNSAPKMCVIHCGSREQVASLGYKKQKQKVGLISLI